MKYADAVTDEKEDPGHDLLPTSSEGPDNEKTCGFLKNWRDRKHRLKLIHSLSVVISFITLGLNAGQSGPTFLDLQLITGVDIERASAFFTGLAVGYLTGSALAGILYIKVNRHIVLFLSTLFMGIAAILTPWCSIYELMVFIRFANGVFHGTLNTAGNTKLMRLWGNEGRVLMQLLHFSFACGGIISPLYSEPFLAHTSNGTRVVSSWSTNTSTVFNTSQIQMEEDTVVYYAFIITGVCAITASLPYFVFFCRDIMRKEKDTKSTLNEEVHQRKLPNLTFIVLLGLLCMFFVLYSCVEGTFASFLVTFLVREFPSVTKSDGAYVMAIFWASLAVSRFLMIFVAILLSSAQLLYLCCILMLVTFIGFLASAFFGSTVSLTVFSACAGLSMSAVFPAGFSWSESELLRITGRISSCIVVFASLGAMINPLILGYLMKESTNMWFCYLLLGQTVAMCLVFIILLYFNRYYVNKRYGRLNDSQLEMSVSADVVQKLDTGNPPDVPPEGGNDGDVIEEHTTAADITEEHPIAGSIKEEHLRAGDAPSCVAFVPVAADKKPFGLLARLKNPQYTRKLWRTMWISGALFTLGMSAGQHGPTLLDLQLITGTDLQRASAFFTGLAVGYLIGAVLCGATFDKINSEWLLFLGTSGLGILSIVTPYCDSYIGMIAVKAGVGLTGGIIDAAGNAEHMQTWGTEGQVLMQLLHFCFALGGVISPLYSEPFLAKKDNHTDEARQVFENFTGAAGDLSEPTNVLYAFVITGIFALLSSIPFFLMLLCYITKQRRRKNKRSVDEKTSDRGRKLPKLLHLFILASLCSFYVAYACLEKTFMSFLMTFLVNEYETVTKSEAAYMTSIYWASFAVSRFLMIFISKLLSAVRLLYLCLIILVITFISFIICAWYGAISALSAFSAMAGLGMSAIFPAGFSWAESELLKVTGRVASAIFVSGSLASMVNPLLLGYLMEYVDNMWFCYFLVGETFLLCIVFLFLLIFNRYFVVPKYGTVDRTSVTIL